MKPGEPAGGPNFWEQWKTILWLRWRLSRNQWRRRGRLDRLSHTVLVASSLITVLVSALGGFLAGYAGLAQASPSTVLYVVDGIVILFLFFWIAGLLTEIQRSENLDITRLMHLPVSLGRIFLFNYASSWLSFSVLAALPALLFLCLGLALSRQALVLALIPSILGFFFLTTAVTYLLRGWLTALMNNERRRRTVIVFTSVLAVAFFQLPNFYFNILRERPGRTVPPPTWLATASLVIPPLWVGASARALVQGQFGPAAGTTAGSIGLGALALLASYRNTLRALRGAAGARTPKSLHRPAKNSSMVSWEFPFISPEVSAIACGTLRSHLRAPEVKMALFGQVVMVVVFSFFWFQPVAGGGTRFFASGTGPMLALLALIGSAQLLFNQFGFDRDGFRSHLLSPVSRKNLLFGKTLAAFPLATGVGFAALLIACIFRILSPHALAGAVLTLTAGFFLFSTLGNWLSIIAPYKVVAGSFRKTKLPPRVSMLLVLGTLLSPVVGAVLLLPTLAEVLVRSLWPSVAPWANIMISAALLGGAAVLYLVSTPSLAHLLERRETDVLAEVTREIE
jgi:ABC-2 type transport system permease protein